MRIVLQRVARASVAVGGVEVASVGRGLVLLVGIGEGDHDAVVTAMAAKVARLRLFPSGDRAFDRTVAEAGGAVMVISQFTLFGDVRRSNRPSWSGAARPDDAEPLIEAFARALEQEGLTVARGRFGTTMDVELVNDGPVTLVLDSAEMARPRR